eukprot:5319481-Amphidinium_carterae.1
MTIQTVRLPSMHDDSDSENCHQCMTIQTVRMPTMRVNSIDEEPRFIAHPGQCLSSLSGISNISNCSFESCGNERLRSSTQGQQQSKAQREHVKCVCTLALHVLIRQVANMTLKAAI